MSRLCLTLTAAALAFVLASPSQAMNTEAALKGCPHVADVEAKTTWGNDDYMTFGACGTLVRDLLYFQSLFGVCAPQCTTPAQVARVVLKFLADHPERHHEEIRRLAVDALRRVWMCKS